MANADTHIANAIAKDSAFLSILAALILKLIIVEPSVSNCFKSNRIALMLVGAERMHEQIAR
jgi:hypothetical protein